MIKDKLKKKFPVLYTILKNIYIFFKNLFFGQKSYSQEGEDLVLYRYFKGKKNGFYIDVGAHHPFRFSNTYKLYKNGWRGVNIDAMPGSMKLFNIFRKRDINLEVPVASKQEKFIYHMFDEPAINTIDKKIAQERIGSGEYKLIGSTEIIAKPLGQILTEFGLVGQKIDFISIDVEGYDLEVLKSNDWGKFSPEVILVESILEDSNYDALVKTDICVFLTTHNYELFAKTVNTLFFRLIGK